MMDLDPDIAVPSVENNETVKLFTTNATATRNDRFAQGQTSQRTTNGERLDSSPSRTPFKTVRTRPSTPSNSSISRSPSVSSLRNETSTTPKLDRKRSVPNLSLRSSTPAHQPQFRRASSNLNPATPLKMKAIERPPLTPASVAKDYFRRELHTHSRTASEVVVFTHDACYGHRFARPRATKAMLGSIVERPERIHATILGASTAYVRLGGRHKEGRHWPHPDREAVPPPFSIIKSSRSIPLNNPAVVAVHGIKWMESLQVMCDSAEAKLAMGQKELARPIGHNRDTKGNTLPPLHSGDLFLSSESLSALQGCLGGVCDAVDTVFQPDSVANRAFVCIRPPGHHCSADLPSGFCWLNNVHVGISYAAINHGLTHAAIIDFDLHHGDGSQTIAWDHNREAQNVQNSKMTSAHKTTPIGYYSLHDINSYPCEYGDEDKVRNASTCLHTAHGQSIWNVHLEAWKSPADFWKLYDLKYRVLLEKAESFLQHHSEILRQSGVDPKAAIFLSSGFDASEWESEFMQRHQVNVPTDFYAKFTADIVEMSQKAHLGVDGRIISVLEGGYSDRALTTGVLSHLCGLTHRPAQDDILVTRSGLGIVTSETESVETAFYDPEWWHQEQLELIEAMVTGRLPQPISKSKDKSTSSYSSPTRASTAKMTETAKERKSLSSQLEARLLLESAPPEPVPEVDWVTAAYELSRLLIPSDRQVLSFTHEELNAENTRARRDRQSLASIPIGDIAEEKMQLRDRKARQPNLSVIQPRTSSRTNNRRTTIAAASELPDPEAHEPPRTRRRSSAGSSVLSGLHDLKLEDPGQTSNIRSVSSRGGSTVSVKADPLLAGKKTRVLSKKPASTANSPRKTKTSAPSTARSSVGNDSVSTTVSTSGAGVATKSDDMDELTNGMKKVSIKLRMPTEEQHIVNQQKRFDETSVVKAKPARKPAVPKNPRTKVAAVTKAKPVQEKGKPLVPSSVPTPAVLSEAVPARPQIPSPTNAPPHEASNFTDRPTPSRTQSAVTMSALEFPSTTQDDASVTRYSSSPIRPLVVNDKKSPTPPALGFQPTSSQSHDEVHVDTGTVTYPLIELKMDSTFPPPAQVAEEHAAIKVEGAHPSIWDVPETPQR